LLLGSVVLVVFLAQFHFVTSLCIDRLLKDADEELICVALRATLLIDRILTFIARLNLAKHLVLLTIDLLMAVHFKLVILFLDLHVF
jgi:hypothetical protein